jgi:hypothetical protein
VPDRAETASPDGRVHPVSQQLAAVEVIMWILLAVLILFLGLVAICTVMGATKLKREMRYQQKLNDSLRDILEGEPT